jgi:UDP-N-acetylmuramate dehydrogenase
MLTMSGIFSDLDVEVALDAPIGAQTWYGIGGRADVLIKPRTIDALATLVKRCTRTKTPLRVLGQGANLLVADEGVDGIVISLDVAPFRAIDFADEAGEIVLTAGAGADMARTLMETARRGYSGLEQMAGIPASIGGAIRMNAGGAFGAIGDAVRFVRCLSSAGDEVVHQRSQITFGYRTSNIADPIILSAGFTLRPADPIMLRERIKEIFAFKKSTQPLADHSAGCSFKNPFDPEIEKTVSAGKLIDEAGLKGTTIGGATVSRQHANFITVSPGAKAEHVIKLMELIRERVRDVHGIELENEVVIWRRGEGAQL